MAQIDVADNDWIGMEFEHPGLDGNVYVPLIRRDQLNADRIFAILERVLQSNEEFNIDGELTLNIVHIPNDTMNGGAPTVTLEDVCSAKRSIIRIQNKDRLCMARAIVTALAHHEQKTIPTTTWDSMRRGRIEQTKRAKELHCRAGVPEGTCDIDDLKKFERVLQGYRLIVLTMGRKDPVVYGGQKGDLRTPLFLYYNDNHYDTITSPSGFLNKKAFCTTCMKGYNQQKYHACHSQCDKCKCDGPPCKSELGTWECMDCQRSFHSGICFRRHLDTKKTTGKRTQSKNTCAKWKRCTTCSHTYEVIQCRPHRCHVYRCVTCQEDRPAGHLCFMPPLKEDKKPKEMSRFIFYDFESVVAPDGRHIPNYCVAQIVCGKCIDDEDMRNECTEGDNGCGQREIIFKGPNTIDNFCTWTCNFPNSILIAHNMKGYDGQFILDCFRKRGMSPQCLTAGTKILYMEYRLLKKNSHDISNTIQFKDSYNFIAMALNKFSKTFGLEEEKGYFPYLFNTFERENYNGPWPAVKYYHPEAMSAGKKAAFMEWYDQQRGKVFDMQKEMKRYCTDDVILLRKGCLKFRRIFMEKTQLDPFVKAMTIAQACLMVYKSKFLIPKTIAIVPHEGYQKIDRHSTKAMQWLAWISHNTGNTIAHARNGGEVTVYIDAKKVKVDGF